VFEGDDGVIVLLEVVEVGADLVLAIDAVGDGWW